MSRDFQLPGRSPVIACEGMAATSHPLASRVAIETLRAGGNAADAAVAAVAVLCVVEPHMTGIGGDCFAMIHVPGKPIWGYNGSGRAGDPLRRKRISGRRTHRLGLGASRRQAPRRCRRRATFPVRRTPSGARRRRQIAGAGAVAQGDRGGGPSRLL
jgi:hypothetical protein